MTSAARVTALVRAWQAMRADPRDEALRRAFAAAAEAVMDDPAAIRRAMMGDSR